MHSNAVPPSSLELDPVELMPNLKIGYKEKPRHNNNHDSSSDDSENSQDEERQASNRRDGALNRLLGNN